MIDALVAKKYNIFSGLNDLIDQDLTASTLNDLKRDSVEDVMEFWGAFGTEPQLTSREGSSDRSILIGPGRLLKEKKLFAEKALKEFSLPSLMDIAQTSPFGFGLGEETVSPFSRLNLGDRLFSLSKPNILSKLRERQNSA